MRVEGPSANRACRTSNLLSLRMSRAVRRAMIESPSSPWVVWDVPYGSARRGAVQGLVDESRHQALVERHPEHEQPVVAGAPELVDDHVEVGVGPQLPLLLRDPQPLARELAAGTGVLLGPGARDLGVGLRGADERRDGLGRGIAGQPAHERGELGDEVRLDVVGVGEGEHRGALREVRLGGERTGGGPPLVQRDLAGAGLARDAVERDRGQPLLQQQPAGRGEHGGPDLGRGAATPASPDACALLGHAISSRWWLTTSCERTVHFPLGGLMYRSFTSWEESIMTGSNERVAIVTGGSGGIGRASALRLAADGTAVVVHYRGNAARAEEVVRAITDAGGRALAVGGDVADEEQAAA